MKEELRNEQEPLEEPAEPLYLAEFENEPVTVYLAEEGEKEITLIGEILAIGRPGQSQEFILDRIQRIALQSEPLAALGGSISLAGPANQVRFEPGAEGVVEGLAIQLYYPQLGDLKPACVEIDATYPQRETLGGRLIWEADKSPDDRAFGLRLTLEMPDLIKPVERGSKVQGFTFKSPVLSFRPLEYLKDDNPEAHSLEPCNTSPSLPPPSAPPPDPPPCRGHPSKRLDLRFYAVGIPNTTPAEQEALEHIVQPWINNAGIVWCQKGGIKLVPFDNIDSLAAVPPDPPSPGQLHPGQLDSNRIEIYLTRGLLDFNTTHGGQTLRCGTNDAYILLDIDAAQANGFLLAHELGHVLDLMHPEGSQCADLRRGSYCSVMVPSAPPAQPTNSSRNTENNISIMDDGGLLLGPPVFTTTGCCSRNPDTETVGPIFENLWNSDQPLSEFYNDLVAADTIYADDSLVFAASGLPNDADPVRGATNHLCVRLRDCQLLSKPIQVYLYRAAEVAPHRNLAPLINNNGPHVTFLRPQDDPQVDRPKTRDKAWEIPAAYADLTQFWVFAVAVTNNTPSQAIAPIITNPGQQDITVLSNLINQSNIYVIGRRLNIQEAIT